MLQQASESVNKITTWFKETWVYLVGILGITLALLRMKSKYDTALSNEKLGETKVEDAKLGSKVASNKEAIKNLESKAKEDKSKASKKSSKQVEDFYNEGE